MAAAPLDPGFQQALHLAGLALQRGDLAGAELAIAPLFRAGPVGDPQVLNVAGLIRLNQGAAAQAAELFARARAGAPREPMPAFNLGRAYAALGQARESEAAFRAALGLKPDFADAWFELGALLHRTGRLEDAEAAARRLLRLMPGHAAATLMLGHVLIDAGRAADAEPVLRRGADEAREPRLKAALQDGLGLALRRQHKEAEALAAYDAAQGLDPTLPGIAIHRAELLQNLRRHEDAVAAFEQALARDPADPELHQRYNDLLYRLGRSDAYLKSYDRAPRTRALLMGKAFFLSHEKRGEEAHALYREVLALDPGDRVAAAAAANCLTLMKRYGEAMQAFDAVLARHGGDPELLSCAAEAALQGGDPQKAAALCEKGLQIAPHDQTCLAVLGAAWRVLEDERDEVLNGYDTLVRSFDLEPPEGFSSMESFNAELNAALDEMHPKTREYLTQSLRGGTQTPDKLFGAGHDLVERIRVRIDAAVRRYVRELQEDPSHPFVSRRARGVGYAGSWSSRLRDCGFHVNHIHPEGWISSCYYVAVPDAVRDERAKQGWIKFGESSFDVALKTPVRRAIQPVPGRLVLFPSYMWHGTIAFRDRCERTTIAFDAVPNP